MRLAVLSLVAFGLVLAAALSLAARTSEAGASVAGTPVACGDDLYEQNDARDDAPPLLQPVEITSLVSCPDDSDWFAFHLFAGDHITIDARYNGSSGDLAASLDGPSGELWATGTLVANGDLHIAFSAPASGIYYVRIDPPPGATEGIDYALALSGDATPTPTPTPLPPLNLNGDWSLNLYPQGIYSGSCFLYLSQSMNSSLRGALGCYGFVPVRVTGSVKADQRSYSLTWKQIGMAFALNDRIDDDLRGSITISGAPDPVLFDMYPIGSIWGDPNCNFNPAPGPPSTHREGGAIDALLLLQHLAGLETSALPCLSMSDVNIDGTIDARDVTLILQHEAGLIPRLPVL